MRAFLYSYHLDEAAVLQLVLQRAGFDPQPVQSAEKNCGTLAGAPRRFCVDRIWRAKEA